MTIIGNTEGWVEAMIITNQKVKEFRDQVHEDIQVPKNKDRSGGEKVMEATIKIINE